MAEAKKIAVFLRSKEFVTGPPDYEYGSNGTKLVGYGWWVCHVMY